MSAGGGDFKGPPRAFLALDIGEVGIKRRRSGGRRRRRTQHLAAFEVIDQSQQIRRRDNLAMAGPGRLRPIGGRTNQAEIGARRADRRRQNPGDRRQFAIEGEFPQSQKTDQILLGDDPHGGQ